MLTGPLHFEIYLLIMNLVFVFLSFFKGISAGTIRHLALSLSGVTIALAFTNLHVEGLFFYESFQVDFYSQFLKLILAIGFFTVIFLSGGVTKSAILRQGGTFSNASSPREDETPEFFLFLSSSFLGMSVLVSSVNFLLFYVALELSSYSLYLLIPMRRNISENQEASLKYFLFGATASGLMLYGLSFLYGISGSLQFSEVFGPQALSAPNPLLFIGILLAASGLFYKLAIVPFHFWAPDVYEETPPSLTAFISTLSKLAGIAVLLRFFAFSQGKWDLLNILLITLSVITMTWGNLAAIRQRDAKRMLAYSSISQVGYLLLGVLAWGNNGYISVIYYTIVYMVMNLGAFLVVSRLSQEGRDPKLEDFQGLAKRSPFLAFIFLLSVFSLAGIPPLAGFTGKWILFQSALNAGFPLLVIWAMINSTVSLYYYLTFVKEAYMKGPASGKNALTLRLSEQIVGFFILLSILFLGIYPTSLYQLVEAAIRKL